VQEDVVRRNCVPVIRNSRIFDIPSCLPARSASISHGRSLASVNGMSCLPGGVDERAFRFLCDVIRFVRTIKPEPGVRRLVDQLVASAGSTAANRQEANGGSSRREFVRFNEIALRSANESVLWLRAFAATGIGDHETASRLLSEARQLARILGSPLTFALCPTVVSPQETVCQSFPRISLPCLLL
jgi:four helix bundle protein